MNFEDRVNLRLVNLDLRPGYLIQYTNQKIEDFNHRIEKCKAFSKIEPVKYYNYIFFTKNRNNIDFSSQLSEEKIAEIIGYKSIIPFDKINRDKDYYIHTVKANNKEIVMNVLDGKPDMSDYYINLVKKFNSIYPAKYKTLFSYELKTIYSAKSIMKKLYNFDKLSEKEILQMWNYVDEYFSASKNPLFKVINLNNPIHRGMMISYLISVTIDPMAQFYPLSINEELYNNKMLKKRESTMVEIIKN